jgi:hypothetical protein
MKTIANIAKGCTIVTIEQSMKESQESKNEGHNTIFHSTWRMHFMTSISAKNFVMAFKSS